MKKVLISGLVLVSLVLTAYFSYQNYINSSISVPKLLFIPKGNTKSVLKHFQKSGLDLHWFDYYIIKRYGYPQAGWIAFKEGSIKRGEFFYRLTHAKAALRSFTIIPGETTEIVLTQLAKKFELDIDKLKDSYAKYAPYPEGVLFAETYKLPIGIDEKALMLHLVTNSLQIHQSLARKYLNQFDQKEWFEKIVTKASIIQKEAADKSEMPIIAKVIENRLKKGMRLQMDGTLNYGKYSHIKVTKKRINEDNSPFNTYKIKALPPYPVSIVSEAAIDALFHMPEVDYLYFVKGKNGKHIFSKSYKKHLYHIKSE